MKGGRFTEGQIVKALKENERGRTIGDLSRELGIDKSTFYYWCKKYSGMDRQELKCLKELEEENRKLKKHITSCIMAMVTTVLEMLAIRYLVSAVVFIFLNCFLLSFFLPVPMKPLIYVFYLFLFYAVTVLMLLFFAINTELSNRMDMLLQILDIANPIKEG